MSHRRLRSWALGVRTSPGCHGEPAPRDDDRALGADVHECPPGINSPTYE